MRDHDPPESVITMGRNTQDEAEIFVAHRNPLAVGAVFGDTVRAGEHDPGAF